MSDYANTRIAHTDFLINGTKFTKYNTTRGGTKERILKLDINQGRILWNSNKLGVINLEWIKRIEFGIDPKVYQLVVTSPVQEIPQQDLARTLVIYYVKLKNSADNVTCLHLVAPSVELGLCWAQTLEDMITEMQQEAVTEEQPLQETFEASLKTWIKDYWTHCDTNRDGVVELKEFKKFIGFMGLKLDDDVVRNLYEMNVKEKNSSQSLDILKALYKQLNPHPEIIKIFNTYAKVHPSKFMMLEEFKEFLKYAQSADFSDEYIEVLYLSFKQEDAPGITPAQFINFLASPQFNPYSNELQEFEQDMTQPLNAYFINSSHNTYLTGNQLKSQSSVSAYINALKDGCRCVELDCWDGPNNEPVVYHGYTLTSKILFKDIISGIAEHAFDTSPYPVILSLENHCSLAQQEVMAKHLKEILGDKLCSSPLECQLENHENLKLPSPEQLKYKILIKCSVGSHSNSNHSHKSSSPPSEAFQSTTPSPPASPIGRLSLSDQPNTISNELEKAGTEGGLSRTKSTSNKTSAKLAEINPYCQAHKFKGLEQTLESGKYNNIVSISESSVYKIMDAAESYAANAKLLNLLNNKLITRIYPAANRVTSSNFNPLAFWLLGSQIVALNFQSYDLGMQLNRAMFPLNRGGYILKPKYMRGSDKLLDIESSEHKYVIDLHLISAHHLPNPKSGINSADEIDPFVEIELLSHNTTLSFNSGNQTILLNEGKTDLNEYPPFLTHNLNQGRPNLISSMVRYSYRSRVVKNNGFNPKFSQKFQFTIGDLNMSFLRFKVSNFNQTTFNTLIGTFCIKLGHLNQGYQYLPVYNQYGKPIKFAKIFIWSSISKYNANTVLNHTPAPPAQEIKPNIPPTEYSSPPVALTTLAGGNQPPHM